MTEEEKILGDIKKRGYWNVIARPAKFEQERLDIESCRVMVEKHQVSLRGWNYPHLHEQGLASGGISFGQDYAECVTSFNSYKELWRMYQSGQFFHAFACGEDYWGDTADQNIFSIFNNLYRLSEIYLFLSRLAKDNLFGSQAVLKIELHNMKHRRLAFVDERFRYLDRVYTFGGDKLVFEKKLKKTDLVEDFAKLALNQFMEIVKRFGLTNPAIRDVFSKEQEKFLKGSYVIGVLHVETPRSVDYGIYRFQEHDPFLNENVWKIRILHPDKRIHKCSVHHNGHILRLWDEADAFIRTIESGSGANFVIPNSILNRRGKIEVKSDKVTIATYDFEGIEVTRP